MLFGGRIKTEKEYEAALRRLWAWLQAGAPSSRAMNKLFRAVERYETEHYPIGIPDEAAREIFRREQEGK